MPVEWIGQYHNACIEPCDMLVGLCVCGAWHHLNEWIIDRKKLTKDGWQEPVKTIDDCVKPLAQYLSTHLSHSMIRSINASFCWTEKTLEENLKIWLEQALDAYESTENVKIIIQKV